MEQPIGEILPKPVYVDLRNRLEGLNTPEIIRVDANLIAADKWPEILEKSQQDMAHRAVVVSVNGEKILVSKIFEGYPEREEDDHGTILAPFFPHGVRSLSPHTKKIAFVHTHPMRPDLDHRTSVLSATDINSFAMNSYNALVAIDRGGVHIIIKGNEHVNRDVDGDKIYKEASVLAERAGSNCTSIIRESMAKQLRANGYYYFYTPNLKSSPDGFIDFKNCVPIYNK
jgi:hypothetical protein